MTSLSLFSWRLIISGIAVGLIDAFYYCAWNVGYLRMIISYSYDVQYSMMMMIVPLHDIDCY